MYVVGVLSKILYPMLTVKGFKMNIAYLPLQYYHIASLTTRSNQFL